MQEDLLPRSGYNRLKSCRYGMMLYNANDIYVGRSFDLYGEFSEGEVALFRSLVRPGDVVVEVGANIGAHTVFFAQAVGSNGRVIAFEPQRLVFQTLCANLALNCLTNVYAYNMAVSDGPGFTVVPVLDPWQPNNFGGLSLLQNRGGEHTRVVTVDALKETACRLLKIDVEGMELQVLRGASQTIEQHKPILYVENDRAEKARELILHIAALGYAMYWHQPPLFNPQNHLGKSENVFGNVVSGNMLCFHRSTGFIPPGLAQVEV